MAAGAKSARSGGGEDCRDAAATLDVRAVDGGSLIRVRLTPKSASNQIIGIAEGALRVRVQAPPVEGAANEKAREFLAKALGVSRGAVSLERGQTSRDKVFRVAGLQPGEVRNLLQSRLS